MKIESGNFCFNLSNCNILSAVLRERNTHRPGYVPRRLTTVVLRNSTINNQTITSSNYFYACTVSLALSVRCQRVQVTRNAASATWEAHLISRSHQLSMNEIQIDGLKSGLIFGKAIGLPQDLMLQAHLICKMLIGQESVQKFTHLRYNIIHTVCGYITIQ